jgi:hypothetical protein
MQFNISDKLKRKDNTLSMDEIIDNAIIQQLAALQDVSHLQLTDPEFMKRQRELALEKLDYKELESAQRFKLDKIKLELKILARFNGLVPAVRKIFLDSLEKYLSVLNSTSFPALNQWLNLNSNINLNLNTVKDSDLTIVADLISNL